MNYYWIQTRNEPKINLMKIDRTPFILLLLLTVLSFISCEEIQTQNPINTDFVDLVYPHLDSENSRWFFFSSASRPFGMVNLSPDTEINGAWGSGYRYKTDTIKGFSHVHGWQISGLSIMPVSITAENRASIYKDFYSKFNHDAEKVSPGYHYVELERQGITAELTSTKRVGFHKYSFPKNGSPAILFNLNTLLGPSGNVNGSLKKIGDNTLLGELEMAPTHRRPKPFKLFFRVEFNSVIESITQDPETGNYVVFTDKNTPDVLMKAAISYTSAENASINMDSELNHWDFQKVVGESKEEWNDFLGRIKIEGGSEIQQRRFYTDLWHALQGRRVISDINGAYPDNTGDNFRIGQIPLEASGKPKFNHYNSDSFWGAQWTINTLWGLVYPDIMEDFVHSLLQYHQDGGLVPRGPSGGNYTYVMTGASSTPFIVSAIQKGIIKEDHEAIYQALKQNHMPGGIMEKAGYEHKTALGGDSNITLTTAMYPIQFPKGNLVVIRMGPA